MCNNRPRRQRGVAILVHSNINICISDTLSSIDTDNEAIIIILKDSQKSASISIIHISPTSIINTALLNNIKNSVDNVIVTGDLNVKHTDFNCTKTNHWGVTLKTALYNTDVFIAENNIPMH